MIRQPAFLQGANGVGKRIRGHMQNTVIACDSCDHSTSATNKSTKAWLWLLKQ